MPILPEGYDPETDPMCCLCKHSMHPDDPAFRPAAYGDRGPNYTCNVRTRYAMAFYDVPHSVLIARDDERAKGEAVCADYAHDSYKLILYLAEPGGDNTKPGE